MKLRRLVPIIIGGFALGAAARASDTRLLVPDFGKIVDVAGAQMSPDPKLHYRIVFGITRAAAKAGDGNPSLDRVARFVNLLARHGVAKDHMAIVAVVSGPATMIVRKPVGTMPNPDARLIAELDAAGVQVVLCSQAAHGHDLTAQDLLPNVRMDVSAITTIAALQMQGYGFIPD